MRIYLYVEQWNFYQFLISFGAEPFPRGFTRNILRIPIIRANDYIISRTESEKHNFTSVFISISIKNISVNNNCCY